MANGEWRMANGEWRMANGEWRMANGEWFANQDGRCKFFKVASVCQEEVATAQRVLALASALEGMSRAEAARATGIER